MTGIDNFLLARAASCPDAANILAAIDEYLSSQDDAYAVPLVDGHIPEYFEERRLPSESVLKGYAERFNTDSDYQPGWAL